MQPSRANLYAGPSWEIRKSKSSASPGMASTQRAWTSGSASEFLRPLQQLLLRYTGCGHHIEVEFSANPQVFRSEKPRRSKCSAVSASSAALTCRGTPSVMVGDVPFFFSLFCPTFNLGDVEKFKAAS